jgi:hypothetical protein
MTNERFKELLGKLEAATTDGDLSGFTQDDIGDLYSWMLRAASAPGVALQTDSCAEFKGRFRNDYGQLEHEDYFAAHRDWENVRKGWLAAPGVEAASPTKYSLWVVECKRKKLPATEWVPRSLMSDVYSTEEAAVASLMDGVYEDYEYRIVRFNPGGESV